MSIEWTVVCCILGIWVATTLGSATVWIVKRNLSARASNIILGFASGIMLSSAIFGLLLPSIEEANTEWSSIPFVPVLVGFLLGCLALAALDKIVPHFHEHGKIEEGMKNEKLSRPTKFLFAVTIHNIPEGIAVGLICGLALRSKTPEAVAAAVSLATGIALQNMPEGSAVSVPMLEYGTSRWKAFLWGSFSGIVEPLFAVISLFIVSSVDAFLPWLLSFAAGAMIYVTVDELLPSARKEGMEHYGLWAFLLGFICMSMMEFI